MLKCSLCNYSDACILVEETISITGVGADGAARQADKRDKGVILKNCAPFINCKTEINNTEIDDCNETRIHNHLVPKRTLNNLAKLTK